MILVKTGLGLPDKYLHSLSLWHEGFGEDSVWLELSYRRLSCIKIMWNLNESNFLSIYSVKLHIYVQVVLY